MSDFISVIGESPFYSGLRMQTWLARHHISRVYPVHAVKDERGQYWKSTPDHEGAEVISYLLIDYNGEEYFCGEEELQQLGIKPQAPKPKIGFVSDETSS